MRKASRGGIRDVWATFEAMEDLEFSWSEMTTEVLRTVVLSPDSSFRRIFLVASLKMDCKKRRMEMVKISWVLSLL